MPPESNCSSHFVELFGVRVFVVARLSDSFRRAVVVLAYMPGYSMVSHCISGSVAIVRMLLDNAVASKFSPDGTRSWAGNEH